MVCILGAFGKLQWLKSSSKCIKKAAVSPWTGTAPHCTDGGPEDHLAVRPGWLFRAMTHDQWLAAVANQPRRRLVSLSSYLPTHTYPYIHIYLRMFIYRWLFRCIYVILYVILYAILYVFVLPSICGSEFPAQVLAYFIRGKLPWQGLDADTKDCGCYASTKPWVQGAQEYHRNPWRVPSYLVQSCSIPSCHGLSWS